jgi:hypothetical protein
MSKTLMVVMALAIGLTFGLATYAKADEKKPAPTTEKKDEKKAESAEKKETKKPEKK